MTATIIRGNALALPLADSSVDLIVTSPPYFGLRSYQDGGAHYAGQIGSEATPAEFVDALIAATREMVRVLKPSGSIWVNLGDKYAGSNGRPGGAASSGLAKQRGGSNPQWTAPRQRVPPATGAPVKSLIGIPWRYALRCIDELGLILRAEIIWSKPNGLPESVTDRVRRSHEQWFHFVTQPRYYSAVDEIREEHTAAHIQKQNAPQRPMDRKVFSKQGLHDYVNPLGKLPGSVWSINEGESLVRSVLTAVSAGGISVDEGERLLWTLTASGRTLSSQTNAGNGQGYSIPRDTPATTPSTSPRTERIESPTRSPSDPSPTASLSIISAATGHASDPTTSSPSPSARTSGDDQSQTYASTATPSTMRTLTSAQEAAESAAHVCGTGCANGEHASGPPSTWVIPTQPLRVPPELGVDHFAAFPMEWPRRIIQGWSPAGGTVCDPFGGTGTTVLVAKALGRHGISIDLSQDYCRLAEWRTSDPGELARALQIEAPEPVPVGQMSLFGDAS